MTNDLILYLGDPSADEFGIRHAEMLAKQLNAHLTGLLGVRVPDFSATITYDGAQGAVEAYVALEQRIRSEADAYKKKLEHRFSLLDVPNEIRLVEGIPSMLASNIASEARFGDLLIVPRPTDGSFDPIWKEILEGALFGSGRGVLLLPTEHVSNSVPGTVLVAWKDTRESARAIAEAEALIRSANRVVIVIVVESAANQRRRKEAPAADIARHLDRLGAKQVEVHLVESKDRQISEVLIAEARRVSAGLIVMGGYGHSKLREWILGGATREMIEDCEIPILLAH
jgi:nucleotide-binding universal stress UspA family protein